jgi:ESS family glutamate:Na+ symporter
MLLVIGQFLRAKVGIFQKVLIPPALIAGFIALLLGPKAPWPAIAQFWGVTIPFPANLPELAAAAAAKAADAAAAKTAAAAVMRRALPLIPLSSGFGTYASVLIAVIFAATPIGDRPNKEALSGPVIGGMFFNITGIAVLQYAVGILVTVYLFRFMFKGLDPNGTFGLYMATGFYGGHGTAAAVGGQLESLGVENAKDLGNTFATIGIVGGILFGMIIINWGTRSGYTHYVTDPQKLPVELRTGLVPPEIQKPGGKITVSTICLDPMAFHVGVVALACLGGYYLNKGFLMFSKATFYKPGVDIPVFCTALLFGFIVNAILNRTPAHQYVDRTSVSRIMGTSTDFLMISGIGSMNLSVVMKYAVPIIIMSIIGFAVTFWWFIFVGGKASREDWFERNMMCWGHATGVAATGVMLQRVVDPDLKSRGIEDSGISDIFNRPIIIILQVVPPIVMTATAAGGAIVGWISLAAVAVMWIVAFALKWWVPKQPLKKYH